MKKIFKDSISASGYCVDTLLDVISKNSSALICLAAGHTSLEFFKMLIEHNKNKKVDFHNVKLVGLDEWVGLSGDDDGSCENFLRKNILGAINIQEKNIRLFDGKAKDLQQECDDIDRFIEENGNIDYMLLGIGQNGHLALNEPGVDPTQKSHIAELDSVTKEVAAKYFSGEYNIDKGITLGIKNILDSKKIQLLITGCGKSKIVKRLFSSAPTNMLPGSLLLGRSNVEFVIDEQAASLINL